MQYIEVLLQRSKLLAIVDSGFDKIEQFQVHCVLLCLSRIVGLKTELPLSSYAI